MNPHGSTRAFYFIGNILLPAVVVRRSIRARIFQQSAHAVILSLWDETEATHIHAVRDGRPSRMGEI